MKNVYLKPDKLKKGDTVAVISPSAGIPSLFPKTYERGLQELTEMGLKIKEYPTARMSPQELYNNPQLRAKDINDAFADNEVDGIIASIGGDDSVRILPYLDMKTITQNPKVFMGYSDTATMTSYIAQHGLVTFNGPTVMAGFAQLHNFDHARQVTRDFLLGDSAKKRFVYPSFTHYTQKYKDWASSETVGGIEGLHETDGRHWLQGSGIARGKLHGGCIEVFEFMKATPFWPKPEFWNDKILFLETSEDKPSPTQVKWMLRNYGSQGILDRISGLLIGRARDYTDEEKSELESVIMDILTVEFPNDFPVVTNVDFGHTDPQIILPLGIQVELDCDKKELRLAEDVFISN